MRPILPFILFLCSALAYGQATIHGRVTNRNGKPVRGALISCSGCEAASTNSRGEFLLKTEGDIDSILVNALPFRSLKVSVKSSPKLQVILQEHHAVVPPSGQSITDLIGSVLASVKQNYGGENLAYASFHREKVSSFNSIIQYLEASLETRRQNGQSTVLANDGLYVEDRKQREVYWNPNTGGFYTFGWQRLTADRSPAEPCFLGVFLKPGRSIEDYYTFRERGRLRESGTTVHIIDFDQQNIKASLLKGTLYVDSATKAIIKIQYAISPTGAAHVVANRSTNGTRICPAPKRIEIIDENGEITFRRTHGQWHYSHGWTETDFHASFDSIASPHKHFLKLSSEDIVTSVKPIQGASTSSGSPWLCADDIKNRFTNQGDHLQSYIIPDLDIHHVLKSIHYHNALWQRNESRKAYLALQERTTHSPELLVADLDTLHRILRTSRAISERINMHLLDQTVEHIRQKITRPLPEKDFINQLKSLMAIMQNENSSVRPSDETTQFNRRFGKFAPFKVRIIGDTMALQDSENDSTVSLVQAINGKKTNEILFTISKNIGGELNSARTNSLVSRKFHELYATHIDQPDSFKLELLDLSSGKVVNRTLAASPFMKEDRPAPQHYVIDSVQAMVVRFPVFQRPRDLENFLNSALTSRQRSHPNLILDLRGNTSDSDSAAWTLLRWVTQEPFYYYDSVSIPTLTISKSIDKRRMETAGSLASVEINPSMNAFQGSVYVLVDEGAGHAAIRIATLLKSMRRGTIIGAELPVTFDLPVETIVLKNSSVRVDIPLGTFHASNTPRALQPDYMTTRKVAMRGDAELNIALELINQACCTARSD